MNMNWVQEKSRYKSMSWPILIDGCDHVTTEISLRFPESKKIGWRPLSYSVLIMVSDPLQQNSFVHFDPSLRKADREPGTSEWTLCVTDSEIVQ